MSTLSGPFLVRELAMRDCRARAAGDEPVVHGAGEPMGLGLPLGFHGASGWAPIGLGLTGPARASSKFAGDEPGRS